jgi:hypothetical protein
LRDDDARSIVARARGIVARASGDVVQLPPSLLPVTIVSEEVDALPTQLGTLRYVSRGIAATWLGGEPRSWARFGIEGEGSCLYHCVVAMLNLDGYWSRSIEEKRDIAESFRCALASVVTPSAVAELRARTNGSGGASEADVPPADSGIVPISSSMSDTTAAAVLGRQLCTPSAWADEPEIRLVLAALGMNVIFIDTKSPHAGLPYCGVHGDAARQPTGVVVWCNRRKHFEPLVRLVGDRTVRPLLVNSRPDDAAAIAAIMGRYTDACGTA